FLSPHFLLLSPYFLLLSPHLLLLSPHFLLLFPYFLLLSPIHSQALCGPRDVSFTHPHPRTPLLRVWHLAANRSPAAYASFMGLQARRPATKLHKHKWV